MKLTDDNGTSMWEAIASKPAKREPGVKVAPKMYMHRKKVKEGPEELADARLNLALLGILNPDGSFRTW